MRTISQNLFDRYLEDNGSLKNWYNETQQMCWVFPYSAKGSLTYNDIIRLYNIDKYFVINVMISFVDNRRFFEVRQILELNIDEYLDHIMQENEFKQAYETLIEFLK